MSESIQANAFKLLRAIFDQVGGDTQDIADSEKAARACGMDTKAARAALGYLFGKGLLVDTREMAELPAVFLTSTGVDAIEGALAYPARATHYFPAVQNIINIQRFSGGAIQQGTTHSTQNVQSTTQFGVDLTGLAADLARIRAELVTHATSSDDYIAVGRIAEAEKAATDGDEMKAGQIVTSLGEVARKVVDAGIRISADVAVSYVKAKLGLPQ